MTDSRLQGDAAVRADLLTAKSPGWVIKFDGVDQHMGRGTTVVKDLATYDALRSTWLGANGTIDLPRSSFSAQQYVEPWLGTGKFRRKLEIRAYAVITSTDPLRLYIWPQSFVLLAFSRYSDRPNSTRTGPSWCTMTSK